MKEENQNVKVRELTEEQIDFRALLFKYIIHWQCWILFLIKLVWKMRSFGVWIIYNNTFDTGLKII